MSPQKSVWILPTQLQPTPSLSPNEWPWVILVALLILTCTSLPFITGYFAQTETLIFRGMLPTQQADNYSYLAKMWQGYWGSWQYQLTFSPEPHNGASIVLFYLGLGHLARLTDSNFILLFHLARVGCGFAMLLLVYRFLALFITSIQTRRVAFLLAVIASGLGWLTESITPTTPGHISPIDFWLIDGYTYLALLAVPHFCAAISLLLAYFILLLSPTFSFVRFIWLIFVGIGLTLIHPYMLAIANAVPLLYWGIIWFKEQPKSVWYRILILLGAILFQLPLVLYQLFVYRLPVFADWSAQNITLSPPVTSYLLGYGMLLVPALLAIYQLRQPTSTTLLFPLLWLGLVILLIYFPFQLQRRFLEGVQIPLGIMAAVGLSEGLLNKIPTRWTNPFLLLLISLSAMTPIYLTLGNSLAALTHTNNLFWSADLIAGVDWLGQHSSPQNIVLASRDIGNLIGGRIGHRVVIGHWAETIHLEQKEAELQLFWQNTTPEQTRTALLAKYGVVYLLHSPFESQLGDFNPADRDYLNPVFQQGEVTIYRVWLDN